MSTGSCVPLPMAGKLGAAWGIAGVSLLFGSAVLRLAPYALELRPASFAWPHWAVLLLCLLLMGYGKGYQLFFRRYAPRVAARAAYLAGNPTAARVLFAPFFCMGFFHATRKRKAVSYGMTALIVAFILRVRRLPQPWHGIVDAGVALGLALGILAIWIHAFQLLAGRAPSVPPDVPKGTEG